jgi:hypothetical protein
VHDFNGGIAPSGLFWTLRVPDSALSISKNGKTAHLHVENIDVVDDLQIFGGANIPATVSFDITWTASGPRHHFKTIGETLPDGSITTSFDGKFRQAVATGTFSGSNVDGFSFTTVGTASSAQDFFGIPGFAEIGIEHNGSYLR